jgi:amino acid transporter
MSDVRFETAAGDDARRVGEEPTELNRVMGPKLLLLFIVGDILGTGIYALTGRVAGEVGGAVWAPFLVAFAIAIVTAFAYLELVTKYPHAGGAASFVHRAFEIHFLTFLVTFTVMASGITSASTASRAFAENLGKGFGWWDSDGATAITAGAIVFILLVAAVNLRGVAESVKTNVVLTLIELSGLLLVIFVGLWAVAGFSDAEVDFSRITIFESGEGKSAFVAVTAATALAFFAMVGFEDSVNMAEETKEPSRIFPKVMLTGLSLTGVIYVLVSITAVALVPVGELSEGATPLLTVVERGAPNLPIDTLYPFIAMFAVANSALINMLMASRLLYGMSRQQVLPRSLGKVHRTRRTPWSAILFTTLLAVGLILLVPSIQNLGDVTALLLLAVFSVVNAAVLVLRRDKVDHDHFRAPTWLPVVGAVACAYMVGPWTGRDVSVYTIAGWLLVVGIGLWALTWFLNRALRAAPTRIKHPEKIGADDLGDGD